MKTNKIESQKLGIGDIKDKKDKRDFRISGIQTIVDLPTIFSLENTFPPKNQFSRGSCTSQAQSHHKERQENVTCSARAVMAWTKELEGNTNYGAMTRNTFKIVNEKGVPEERLYQEPGAEMGWEEYINTKYIPETAINNAPEHKSNSYWRVENSPEAIKQTIYQNLNSVVISMAWYREFNRPPEDGILKAGYKKENYVGGHAVEIEGWNNHIGALQVKNSWGTGWGKNGRFFIPYELCIDLIWDAWCSLDIPQNLPIDEYYGQERTWNKYLQEKTMAFNPWLYNKINRLPNNREIKGLVYGFWSFDAVFNGKVKDIWLKETKPSAIKNGIIDENENLL